MAINGTLTKIETTTVGAGGAASFVFTGIPATYDDLYIVLSGRSDRSNIEDFLKVAFNSDTTDGNYSGVLMYGQGSGAGGAETFTSAGVPRYAGNTVGATATASIFSNVGIYIAGYRTSRNKTYSVDVVTENNATASRIQMATGVWANNAAITSVTLSTAFGTLVQYSSATIYGVSNVSSTAKATGGMLFEDSTYLYHLFTTSGIFTPLQALTTDVLVLAGGGGAATGTSGGGGAGQVLLYSNQNLAATAYAVTIGAGGAGGSQSDSPVFSGANGSTSQFGSTTAAVGGNGSTNETGASAGNGNSGGNASISTYYTNGGGGGLGGNGGNGDGSTGQNGVGGAGNNSYASWLNATLTGVNGFIGGGGGGGGSGWSNNAYLASYGATGGTGGGGGGGRSGYNDSSQMPGGDGVTNTGSGGGGGGYWFQAGVSNRRGRGGNGGSGLVIVRYTK